MDYLPGVSRLGPFGYKYYDAVSYIAQGDTEGAIAAVREFIEMGGCIDELATEVYTTAIHNEPEFKELVAINESRLAAQRKRLSEMEANGELAPIPSLPISLLR